MELNGILLFTVSQAMLDKILLQTAETMTSE
jgi:hypothetical protein